MITAAFGIAAVSLAAGYALGHASGLRRARREMCFEITWWKSRAAELEKEPNKC
jgi:hypothetical protein